MIRHLCIRAGDWKLENWHLYRWRPIVFGPKQQYTRYDWVRVL